MINEQEETQGEKSLSEALKIATAKGLDLVEVSPNSNPPVCKIMDYGKHLYRLQKAKQKHKAHQKKNETKNIRLSFRIGQHDMEVKAKQSQRFLDSLSNIKVTLQFKGREIEYLDLGKEKLLSFFEMIKDHGEIEQMPKKQGYSLFMIVKPLK